MRKNRVQQKAATFLERKQKSEEKKTRTEEEAAISKAAIFETATTRENIRAVEIEKKVDGMLRQIIGSSEALEKDQKEHVSFSGRQCYYSRENSPTEEIKIYFFTH